MAVLSFSYYAIFFGITKCHSSLLLELVEMMYIVLFLFYCLLFRLQEVMEPPIPLKGVVLFIAFGSMVSNIAVGFNYHYC